MFEKRVSQSERRIRNSHVTSMRTACTGSTPLERSAGRGHRFPAHDIYIDNRSELRKMRHRADSAMRRTLFRPGAREGLSYLAIYLSLIWASEASPPSRTNGTIFLLYVHRPTVSPDTVSLLNVSTRFYLGVHAVRNIAILYSRSPTMLKHSSSN